jgi:hypothetical protein
MTARRLRHALANTLDALASRNSDVDGWYLWGVVVRDAPHMTISLCSDALDALPVVQRAVARNVIERLARQLRRCSPPVQSADLVDVGVMITPCAGGVDVTLLALLSNGTQVERTRTMSAQPHNPKAELRSVRREPTTPLRPLLEWL